MTPELDDLLRRARAASPSDRVDFRDKIAAHGASAVEALIPWAEHAPDLGRFAVLVIGRAADAAGKSVVGAALKEIGETAPHLRAEVDQQLERLRAKASGTKPQMRTPHESRIDWTLYDSWNEKFSSALLDAQYGQESLYLDTDAEWLNRVITDMRGAGEPATAASDALAPVIVGTLGGSFTGRRAFAPHRARANEWQRGSMAAVPPFLTVLIFLVSIAEEMVAEGKFAANNYYGRLTDALVRNGARDYQKGHVEHSYRNDADPLWRLFNKWLDDQDGRYGLPTAYPSGSLPYVSVPIGQALLRERDRHVLHRVFAAVFGQQRDLTADDLREALARQISHPPFSKLLASMWRNADRRKFIASLLLRELDQWDGTTVDPATSRRSARIVLAATLRTFPRRSVLLSPHVRRGGHIAGKYKVAPSDIGIVTDAGVDTVEINENVFGSSLLDFEPTGAIAVPELLLRRIKLSGLDADLVRPFRLCTVLALDPGEQRYVEVERVQTGERSLVLVHDSTRADAIEILGAIARPGWEFLSSAEIEGLPDGWGLLANVEVMAGAAVGSVSPDLVPLLPNAELSLSFDGGIRLPGSGSREEWLVAAPPELVVSDADAGVISLSIETDGVDEPAARTFARVKAMGVVAMPVSVSGAYVIRAEAAGRTTSRRLVLRDSDEPRAVPPTAEIAGILGREGALKAIGRPQPGAETISLVSPQQRSDEGPLARADTGLAKEITGGQPEDWDEAGPSTYSPVDQSTLPPCAVRPGAHHWDLPDSHSAVVSGTCRYCGLRRYFFNTWYGRRSAARELRAKQLRLSLGAALRSFPLAPESSGDRLRDLPDALATIGAGSWATFEGLSRLLVPTAHPAAVARQLSALGLIDLDVGAWRAHATAWSSPEPAVLALGANQHALLGRHSGRLLREFGEVAEAYGGSVLPGARRLGPVVFRVRASLPADVVAEELSDRTGVRIGVANPAALLSWLPVAADLLAGLEPTLIYGEPEVFDFAGFRWRGSTLPRPGQAVRFGDRPRVYGIATDKRSQVLRTDYRLAKHVSSHQLGLPLMAYDSESRVLSVPLGADLPEGYERVAVMCSGEPPAQAAGRLIYAQVPLDVAEGLWHRLGPRMVT